MKPSFLFQEPKAIDDTLDMLPEYNKVFGKFAYQKMGVEKGFIFTGLKDIRKVPIWEGSIIRKTFTDRPYSSKAKSFDRLAIVYWDNSDAAFDFRCIDLENRYGCYSWNFKESIVVGHISLERCVSLYAKEFLEFFKENLRR